MRKKFQLGLGDTNFYITDPLLHHQNLHIFISWHNRLNPEFCRGQGFVFAINLIYHIILGDCFHWDVQFFSCVCIYMGESLVMKMVCSKNECYINAAEWMSMIL